MARRGMLTLASLVLTVVTMIGLVPFVLSVVSIPLFVVWVGIPLFLGSTLLTRAWSNGGRWLAGSILGEPVARPYRAVPAGTGFFGRVRIWLTDPATWRDLLWLLVSCTAGFTIAVLVLTFAAGTLFYLAQPLLLYLTPPGIFDDPFGGLVHLSHWTHGFFMWPLAALVFGLWWATTPALMKAWAHMARALLAPTRAAVLAGQVASLSSSRAETRDSAAAELRRIERDLHDGVQVKLASLGMSLGLIEQLMVDDPERARAMLAEASTATTGTMEDLRSLVRGIHPPVLADRGLVGAVEALTLDVSVPVSFTVTGCTHPDGEPIRFDAPVESCLYFGIAESLANVVKHSGATRATVTLVRRNDRLVATVSDNGRGGAEPAGGSGLTGLERRLRAFDGSLQIDSPVGGPTTISMEVPCETPASEHSSPKTTPSSARG